MSAGVPVLEEFIHSHALSNRDLVYWQGKTIFRGSIDSRFQLEILSQTFANKNCGRKG
jgi:hypothetical protein